MTPQRMVDLQNVLKNSVKRIGVNGMIDVRATYYAPDAASMDATLEELHDAALALGMTRISNWQYRESSAFSGGPGTTDTFVPFSKF